MRGWWVVWVMVLTAAGCHGLARAPMRPQEQENNSPISTNSDLPPINPSIPILDARELPKLPPRTISGPDGSSFRRVREADCLFLAANNTATANLLEENRESKRDKICKAEKSELRKSIRYYTALELRNRSAADALERFFQLTELETRTDLLRKSLTIIEGQINKARSAKAADVRYPVELADLAREWSFMESQLELAEQGSKLLNLDLKRRLGLPYAPSEERLWPMGGFSIDPTPLDVEAAVNAAMADRPELRGLRSFHQGLTVETLPEALNLLRIVSPLLGLAFLQTEPRFPWLVQLWLLCKGPNASVELAARKKQLLDIISERERAIADETRAAVITANSQRVRATLARDRTLICEDKLADAEKKRAADQPGAEFLVPKMQLELLKARSEVAAEVAAWHQARIKVKAAEGWLVWESMQTPEMK